MKLRFRPHTSCVQWIRLEGWTETSAEVLLPSLTLACYQLTEMFSLFTVKVSRYSKLPKDEDLLEDLLPSASLPVQSAGPGWTQSQ